MNGLPPHLRGRLHLFGVTEADFVMPPVDDPAVRRTPAGLELRLTDALAEAERQGRRGVLLVAWPGAGVRAFLDAIEEERGGVARVDAVEWLAGDDPGPPSSPSTSRADPEPLVVVEGLDRLDPESAISRKVGAWVEALPRTRFLVTTRPDAVPPDRLGPHFLEVRVAGLDEAGRRHVVGACLHRIDGEANPDGRARRADELLARLGDADRRGPEAFRLATSPLALTVLTVLDEADVPLPGDADGLLDAWTTTSPRFRKLPGPHIEDRLRAFARASSVRTRSGRADPPPSAPWAAIPPGTFRMGSPDGEEGRWNDEGPVHEVRVEAFELGARPVTNAEYGRWLAACPEASPPAWWDDPEFTRPDQPVVGVAWHEARAYAQWAGARLPTESEWEYACRAATSGPRYGKLAEVAWYRGNSGATLHPTGRRRPNAWGVYDTLGNAWEWVEDDHHPSYAGAPSDGRGWIDAPRSDHRILRGGSWADAPRVLRAATRLRDHPGPRIGNVSFRLARAPRGGIGVDDGRPGS